MKHLYRVIVLFLIFVGSFYFMSSNIKEVNIELAETVAMSDATFPTVTLVTGEYELNLMHGYSSNLSATEIRDHITPLVGEQAFTVSVKEQESEVRKIKYELSSIAEESVLESETISALDTTKEGKSVRIRLKSELTPDEEYALELVVTTSLGKKIHYYSRLKYYPEDTGLKEKIEFVERFHRLTMAKDKVSSLSDYMETDYTKQTDSLSLVTIHSDMDSLSYGNLEVVQLTTPIPRIYEYNEATASILLEYYLAADAGSAKPETYRVKEYFRVRSGNNQMYLLDYRRSMEAQFDIDLISVKKNEIKLGISEDSEIPVLSSADNSKMCFVRQGALWYYNLIANKATSVFSFQKEQLNDSVNLTKKGKLVISDQPYDYERDCFDQHDIRVLNMDNSGNIDFMVYGYMNRGDYEGRVGIALYHFYAEREEIEEEVYIPVEKTYQYLKEELDNFGYVNEKNVFYFSVNHIIYRYSIAAQKLETVATGSTQDYFQMVEQGQYFVWQNSDDPKTSTKLSIRNLEQEITKNIKAPKGASILLLGVIQKNFICGYVKTGDIQTAQDGSVITPMYQINICDSNGKVLKEYQSGSYYVTGITVNSNIISMERVSMTGSRMREAPGDSLINNEEEITSSVQVTTRVTELAKTELYLTFPGGFEMEGKPVINQAEHVILEDDTTLLLDESKSEHKLYYAYAYGEIQGVYENAGMAIAAADPAMGTVTEGNEVIWERGNYLIRNKILGITPMVASSGHTVTACLSMLLTYAHSPVAANQLVQGGVYEIMEQYLDGDPLNLTGMTTEQLFYFLSDGRPVIGMVSQRDAVLITGYDELYLYMINPVTGIQEQMTLELAEHMFSEAGSVFISYR